jgi:hypothetical protein
MLTARGVVAQERPVGCALGWVANLAGAVRVFVSSVEAFAADYAGAWLARAVGAALPRFAAQPAAANLIGKSRAGRFVGQEGPVEWVFARIANLAGVARIRCFRRDRLILDRTETLAAGIEQATLV